MSDTAMSNKAKSGDTMTPAEIQRSLNEHVATVALSGDSGKTESPVSDPDGWDAATPAAIMTPEMRRRLDIAAAGAWIPKILGEEIAGTVVAILKAEITNQFGHQIYPKVVLEQTSGKFLCVHALGKVLIGELRKIRPVVGDGLAFRYGGKVEGAGGTYALITIVGTSDASETFDWSDASEVTAEQAGF